MKELFKKIICFIFRKRIAELKAEKIADETIKSMKTVTSSGNKENLPNLKNHRDKIQKMQEAGIKKVELICQEECKCCKDIKNKQIDIKEIITLPPAECEYDICYGRYVAVVDFNLK